MKAANSYLPHLIRNCSRLQHRMLKTCLYGQWDGEFFISKTHNNTQYKQWQITSGTGVWVLVSLQMRTANNSCSQWIWSLQQFDAFINTHLYMDIYMWGDINFYLSGRTHSSGLFHLHTNNCNLHSSIGHIKPLAYSLQFAASIIKKMFVWNISRKRGNVTDNIIRGRERWRYTPC
jgi:hypothetical protein